MEKRKEEFLTFLFCGVLQIGIALDYVELFLMYPKDIRKR